jgi:hypothetical protein
MSSVCCGSVDVAVAGPIVESAGGAGLVGATTGVLMVGATDVRLAGVGEDDTDVAPAQTSTATNPRLSRRPHDECQARPGILRWSVGASRPGLSVRSSSTSISPPANTVIGCSSGLSEPH